MKDGLDVTTRFCVAVVVAASLGRSGATGRVPRRTSGNPDVDDADEVTLMPKTAFALAFVIMFLL